MLRVAEKADFARAAGSLRGTSPLRCRDARVCSRNHRARKENQSAAKPLLSAIFRHIGIKNLDMADYAARLFRHKSI
jgi:hypothetical protein